jgi:hypothetical protein
MGDGGRDKEATKGGEYDVIETDKVGLTTCTTGMTVRLRKARSGR